MYKNKDSKPLISGITGFAPTPAPQYGARQVFSGAWLCILAVVPAFKCPSGLVRIIVAIPHGTRVNQLFLAVDAV